MKTALLAVLTLCVFTVGAAQAQAPSRRAQARAAAAQSEGSFVAPRIPAAAGNITAQAPATDGVVPRAARSGNPFQMLNPFAPAEYGSGREVTRTEDGDPYANPRGIRLATVEF